MQHPADENQVITLPGAGAATQNALHKTPDVRKEDFSGCSPWCSHYHHVLVIAAIN